VDQKVAIRNKEEESGSEKINPSFLILDYGFVQTNSFSMETLVSQRRKIRE